MSESDLRGFSFNATVFGLIWHVIKVGFFALMLLLAGFAIMLLFAPPIYAFHYNLSWMVKININYYLPLPDFISKILMICPGLVSAFFSFKLTVYSLKWFVSQISYGLFDNRLELEYGSVNDFILLVKDFLKPLAIIITIILIIIGLVFSGSYFGAMIGGDLGHILKVAAGVLFVILAISIFLIFSAATTAILAKAIIENTTLDGHKFTFTKTSWEYTKILLIETLKALIFTPLTLGLYSIWAFIRFLRITASCVRHEGKQLHFSEELNGVNVFIMMLISSFFVLISFGLLAPWRFIKDTNEILGYAYLK